MPFEFFFFATGFAKEEDVAGLGVLEVEVKDDEPRVGTGGITNFETSTLLALRLADFFAVRFALRADFFAVRLTARFAGRFAAALFAGRLRAADFFFVATEYLLIFEDSSLNPPEVKPTFSFPQNQLTEVEEGSDSWGEITQRL